MTGTSADRLARPVLLLGVVGGIALPAVRTALALLGINGAERGQLATPWPACWLLSKRLPEARQVVVQVGAACVLAAGLFWFLTRALDAA